MYAQCPSCNTTFAITVAQLDARDGVVRCGRCFDVFNARWNLVDRQDHEKQKTTAAPEPGPSAPREKVKRPAAKKTDATPSVRVKKPGAAQPPQNKASTGRAATESAETAKPAPSTQENTRSSLVSMRTGGHGRAASRSARNLGDAFGKGEVQPGRRMSALDAATEAPQTDSLQKNVGPSPGQESGKKIETKPARQPKPSSRKRPQNKPTELAQLGDTDEGTATASRNAVIDRSQFEDLSVPTLGDGSSEHADGHSGRRIPAVFWILGSLMLLGLLALQAKTFYLHDIAQRQALRPAGKILCLAMRCELPAPVRFDEYQIEKTRIAFHPDAPAAIRISTSVRNRADVEQPYPDLQLTLTDKTGKIVGRRNFRPAQYLGPEFRAENKLAAESVTIIDLDLAEPAQSAIGFEVQLVKPLAQ